MTKALQLVAIVIYINLGGDIMKNKTVIAILDIVIKILTFGLVHHQTKENSEKED